MFEQKSFTFSEIKNYLNELKIQFDVHGVDNNHLYSFKSIWNVDDYGIFFVAPNINRIINNSIVFSSLDIYEGKDNITIRVNNPQLTYYKLMEKVFRKKVTGYIHPTAIVDSEAEVSPSAYIGPYCVLGNCRVQDGVFLYSHVVVMDGSTLENNVSIESHSTIGATGVAWTWDPDENRRVVQPQIGFTRIGQNTFLGSGCVVVRGSINECTSISENCVVAPGAKIGHGVQIGEGCHLANNVTLGGNVKIAAKCFLGSGAVVRPQIYLAESTIVGAGAVVVSNNEEKNQLLVGVPAKVVVKKSNELSGVPTQY